MFTVGLLQCLCPVSALFTVLFTFKLKSCYQGFFLTPPDHITKQHGCFYVSSDDFTTARRVEARGNHVWLSLASCRRHCFGGSTDLHPLLLEDRVSCKSCYIAALISAKWHANTWGNDVSLYYVHHVDVFLYKILELVFNSEDLHCITMCWYLIFSPHFTYFR